MRGFDYQQRKEEKEQEDKISVDLESREHDHGPFAESAQLNASSSISRTSSIKFALND